MKMNSILLRIAIVVFAVGFTAFTFNFWGDFSRAMDNYLTMTTKEDAKPKPTGVVTMSIIQPKQPAWPEEKIDCHKDKSHPCPKQ